MSNFRKPKRGTTNVVDVDQFVQGDQEKDLVEEKTPKQDSRSPSDEPMKKATGFYITPNQKKWLRLQAISQDTNVSEVLRQILNEAIEKEEM